MAVRWRTVARELNRRAPGWSVSEGPLYRRVSFRGRTYSTLPKGSRLDPVHVHRMMDYFALSRRPVDATVSLAKIRHQYPEEARAIEELAKLVHRRRKPAGLVAKVKGYLEAPMFPPLSQEYGLLDAAKRLQPSSIAGLAGLLSDAAQDGIVRSIFRVTLPDGRSQDCHSLDEVRKLLGDQGLSRISARDIRPVFQL